MEVTLFIKIELSKDGDQCDLRLRDNGLNGVDWNILRLSADINEKKNGVKISKKPLKLIIYFISTK